VKYDALDDIMPFLVGGAGAACSKHTRILRVEHRKQPITVKRRDPTVYAERCYYNSFEMVHTRVITNGNYGPVSLSGSRGPAEFRRKPSPSAGYRISRCALFTGNVRLTTVSSIRPLYTRPPLPSSTILENSVSHPLQDCNIFSPFNAVRPRKANRTP